MSLQIIYNEIKQIQKKLNIIQKDLDQLKNKSKGK